MSLVVRVLNSDANIGDKYIGLDGATYTGQKGTGARTVTDGTTTYTEGTGSVTSVRVGKLTNNGDFVLYDI